MRMVTDERIEALPDAQSCDEPCATSWLRKTPWTQLRVWVYQEGSLRELPSLHALSGLSAWKSGRAPVGASFVAGTKLIDDPARVDWTGFSEDEGLEAEGEAPLPCVVERPPTPPQRDARKLQVDALREIDRVADGVPRGSVHPRTAGALLNRGLVEIAVVESQTVLRITTIGREVLHRPPRRRGPARRE